MGPARTTCVFCGMERADTELASRNHLLTECPEMTDDDRRAVLAPGSVDEREWDG